LGLLDYVDKGFLQKSDLKAVTQDGAYMFMRELNNTASKKERDAIRDADPERANEAKAQRVQRKRGQVTEGIIFSKLN